MYVSLVAIVETIARRSFLPVTSSESAGVTIAVCVGALMAAGMGVRWTRPGVQTAKGVLALNIATVVGATALTLWIRPAHRQIPWDWVPGIFTTYGPSRTYVPTPDDMPPPPLEDLIANGQLVPYLDALVTVSLAATAIALLLAVGVVLRGFTAKLKGGALTPARATSSRTAPAGPERWGRRSRPPPGARPAPRASRRGQSGQR